MSRCCRSGEIAGWIIPRVLPPKCPACVAAHVALFSGLGISMANASNLRMSLLILGVAALFGLALKRLCLLAAQNEALSMAQTQFPAHETSNTDRRRSKKLKKTRTGSTRLLSELRQLRFNQFDQGLHSLLAEIEAASGRGK